MLQLTIIHNPQDYKIKAENYFSASFCRNLKIEKPGTYIESLVARYCIETHKNMYSSISHKKNLVFIGVSTEKVGVDIEIIKDRGVELLESFSRSEYTILGAKSLENFYTLWTAKEAIIKYENLLLDDMEEIILDNVEMFLGNIGGLIFQRKLILTFKNKNFIVYCGQEENVMFSVCVSNEIG